MLDVLRCMFFLLAAGLWAQGVLYAQNKHINNRFEKLSIPDGLSNRLTHSTLQDNDGFIWMGTSYGLCRYDGYEIKSFTTETHALQSDRIRNIYQDQNGWLWVHYPVFSGKQKKIANIDLLNPQTEEIIAFEDYFPKKEFKQKDILYVKCLNENEIWITTRSGKLYKYNAQSKQLNLLKDFSNQAVEGSRLELTGGVAGDSSVWFQCDNLIWHYPSNQLDTIAEITPEAHITMRWATKEALWFSMRYYGSDGNGAVPDSLVRFDLITKNIEIKGVGDVFPHLQHHDIGANTHFGSHHYSKYIHFQDRYSLFIFDSETEEVVFELSSEQLKKLYDVPHAAILNLYLDRNETLWINTDDGVLFTNFKKTPFRRYLDRNSGHPSSTRSMIELDSVLYVNSYSGFKVLDLRKPPDSVVVQSAPNPTHSYILSACIGPDSSIWTGAESNALWSYNPKKNTELFYEVGLEMIWSIYYDAVENRLWLGHLSGISFFDLENQRLQHYTQYNEFDRLKKSAVYHFVEDGLYLWACTSEGLFKIHKTNGVEAFYSSDQTAPYFLPHRHIYYAHLDKSGHLWLASRGGGLIFLDPENGQFQQYTTKNGLSNNIIYTIFEDDYNRLWITSDYGLMCFDKKSKLSQAYFPEDGLTHEEFNAKSAYQAADGTFYLGGIEGISAFHPKDFAVNQEAYNAKLAITYFGRVDLATGRNIDETYSLLQNQKIDLQYGNRSFMLKFSLLDFRNLHQRNYAYKIEGLGDQWQYISENFIRVNGLASGNYTLKIKAQGPNGAWSNQVLNIPIMVAYPFYQTSWFLVLMVLLIGGMVALYINWMGRLNRQLETQVVLRTKKIAQQTEELKELDVVKSRFFANVSHELRTPLTLILGPVGKLLQKKQHINPEISRTLELVEENSYRLKKLIDEILDLSKLDANKLEVHTQVVDFYPFMQQLCGAFAQQARLQEIDYVVDCPADLGVWVELDTSKFEKIINNLVNNALKFTPKNGKIAIRIVVNGAAVLSIEIQDSGVGIHPKDIPYIFDRYYQSKEPQVLIQGGTGIGLALCKEFTTLLGGEIWVESLLGAGTTFFIHLPFHPIEKTVQMSASLVENGIVQPALLDTDATETFKEDKSTHILIVEDNASLRQFTHQLLEPLFTVHTAQNGEEALAFLKQTQRPDIHMVISDIMMPLMDGFMFLENLKKDVQLRNLPVILLTARAQQKDKLKALTMGIDDYLTKPFSPTELLSRVQNILTNQQQRRNWILEQTALNHQRAIPDTEAASQQKTEPDSEQKEEYQHTKRSLEVLVNVDHFWLKEVEEALRANVLGNVGEIAAAVSMSERNFRRKLKANTGLSPNKYITEVKMNLAREWLEERKYRSTAQIASAVGFNTAAHFVKLYTKRFGEHPNKYF